MASNRLCFLAVIAMAAATGKAVSSRDPCYCSQGGPTANCSNNHFDEVPAITCDTSHLLVLDLSWNNLDVLERDAFNKLVTLQDLSLDHARVRLVHKDAFHNLKDLKKLDLSFNYIEQLHSETFWHLENLQELHLRQNPLKVLANNIFSGLKGLATLDLRSCGLVSISEEIFRSRVSAKTSPSKEEGGAWPIGLNIDVSDNPLNCNCALKDFHDVVTHSSQYDNLTCAQPEDLRGYPLRVLDSADLKCKPYEILFPLRNTTFLAPRGRNVTLSCRIANDPHLPWLKRWTFHAGESVVPETLPRFVISSSNLWLNLTIERVRPSDEGIYKCEVYNRAVRVRTYRKVSLVVFEDFGYLPEHLGQETNTTYLVASILILATLLSVVVFVLVALRRKRDVYTKKAAFKKNRDFMISVPFYASADGLLPTRPLPRRPGSEVLPWWLEYPEHLYEDVDSRHSLAHPTKHTARPGEVQYDREHYVRPATPRAEESSRQATTTTTTHTYTTVLPDED